VFLIGVLALPQPPKGGILRMVEESGTMSEIVFFVEEDAVDGGWVARAPGEGITTQGDTLDELKAMIRDALRCHFDDEAEIPPLIRLHFAHDEVFAFAD